VRTLLGAIVLVALLASPAAAWSIAIEDSTPPPPLEIHLLGRSVLVRTPGGRSLLFDAGPEVTPETLGDLGVGRLNVLVVTAVEPGRTENLGQLLRRLPVDEVFDSGYGPGRLADLPPGYRLFLEELAARGIPYRLARAGERVEPEPGVILEFLNPRGLRPHPRQHAVATRLVHREVGFVLAGALDAPALAHLRAWLREDPPAHAWLVGGRPDPLPSGSLVLVGPQQARFRSDGSDLERLPDR